MAVALVEGPVRRTLKDWPEPALLAATRNCCLSLAVAAWSAKSTGSEIATPALERVVVEVASEVEPLLAEGKALVRPRVG